MPFLIHFFYCLHDHGVNALLHSSTFAIIKNSQTKANNNDSGGDDGDDNDGSGGLVGGGVHTKINDVTGIAKAKVFFNDIVVVVVFFFIFLSAVSIFFNKGNCVFSYLFGWLVVVFVTV